MSPHRLLSKLRKRWGKYPEKIIIDLILNSNPRVRRNYCALGVLTMNLYKQTKEKERDNITIKNNSKNILCRSINLMVT